MFFARCGIYWPRKRQTMNFTITYGFDPVTRQYVAEVPEFQLSDFGATLEEAESNVRAALGLYLEEAVFGVPEEAVSQSPEYA